MQLFFDFIQIVLADIVLSGDNALIIAMAAGTLSPELRRRAIIYGLVVAAGLRIIFAIFATYLLAIKGLLFLGGLLLLWVSWRLWVDIGHHNAARDAEAKVVDDGEKKENLKPRSMMSALISITIADFSMSIDNVLAVAAIARGNTALLVFGLVLAILLMGFGATIIVRLMNRYPWISYAGLVVLIFTSLRMLWEGWPEMAVIVGLA